MAPTTVIDDPIVAIYPVPGEVDSGTDKTPALAPIPVRLERTEAERAVKRGAFSYTDPSQAAVAKAAPGSGDAPNAKALKAAEAEAAKAASERDAALAEIESLKAALAAKG